MTRDEIAGQIAEARASLDKKRDELAESIKADIAKFRQKAIDAA